MKSSARIRAENKAFNAEQNERAKKRLQELKFIVENPGVSIVFDV